MMMILMVEYFSGFHFFLLFPFLCPKRLCRRETLHEWQRLGKHYNNSSFSGDLVEILWNNATSWQILLDNPFVCDLFIFKSLSKLVNLCFDTWVLHLESKSSTAATFLCRWSTIMRKNEHKHIKTSK